MECGHTKIKKLSPSTNKMRCEENTEIGIHQRPLSAVVQGDIRTPSLFDHLDSTNRQVRTEYDGI